MKRVSLLALLPRAPLHHPAVQAPHVLYCHQFAVEAHAGGAQQLGRQQRRVHEAVALLPHHPLQPHRPDPVDPQGALVLLDLAGFNNPAGREGGEVSAQAPPVVLVQVGRLLPAPPVAFDGRAQPEQACLYFIIPALLFRFWIPFALFARIYIKLRRARVFWGRKMLQILHGSVVIKSTARLARIALRVLQVPEQAYFLQLAIFVPGLEAVVLARGLEALLLDIETVIDFIHIHLLLLQPPRPDVDTLYNFIFLPPRPGAGAWRQKGSH